MIYDDVTPGDHLVKPGVGGGDVKCVRVCVCVCVGINNIKPTIIIKWRRLLLALLSSLSLSQTGTILVGLGINYPQRAGVDSFFSSCLFCGHFLISQLVPEREILHQPNQLPAERGRTGYKRRLDFKTRRRSRPRWKFLPRGPGYVMLR